MRIFNVLVNTSIYVKCNSNQHAIALLINIKQYEYKEFYELNLHDNMRSSF